MDFAIYSWIALYRNTTYYLLLLPCDEICLVYKEQGTNTINHASCSASLANQIDGATYANTARKFPHSFLAGKQYKFVKISKLSNARREKCFYIDGIWVHSCAQRVKHFFLRLKALLVSGNMAQFLLFLYGQKSASGFHKISYLGKW